MEDLPLTYKPSDMPVKETMFHMVFENKELSEQHEEHMHSLQSALKTAPTNVSYNKIFIYMNDEKLYEWKNCQWELIQQLLED